MSGVNQSLILYPDYTMSRKRTRNLESCSTMSSELGELPKRKRVRAKLDHLTPDEKLNRRKMKNRIAAQTARDRKRERIDKLEDQVRIQQEEIEFLKSQLQMVASQGSFSDCPIPDVSVGAPMSINVTSADSGINPLSSSSTNSTQDSNDMDQLVIPKKEHLDNPTTSGNFYSGSASPRSPGSSSGAYSASPIPESLDTHIDSVVGEPDEAKLMDEIIQLDQSLHCETGNNMSFGSAASINVTQQQYEDVVYQSPLVENSAGWTSIQLMLLLMISKVHRLFSKKTNCCTTIHSGVDNLNYHCDQVGSCNNLYDYILQTRCIDFRRAAEAIISNKNNVRQQKLVALEFVYIYLYNVKLFRDRLHNSLSKIIMDNIGQ